MYVMYVKGKYSVPDKSVDDCFVTKGDVFKNGPKIEDVIRK